MEPAQDRMHLPVMDGKTGFGWFRGSPCILGSSFYPGEE